METTPRHSIKYPSPTDLVSGASAQFKAMAESIDDTLDELPAQLTEAIDAATTTATTAAQQARDAVSQVAGVAAAGDTAIAALVAQLDSATRAAVVAALHQPAALALHSGWKAYNPVSAESDGHSATLHGAAQRTSATWTAKAWTLYDIADVPAPAQVCDFIVANNSSGAGGVATVRITTDGVLSLRPFVDTVVTQNQTWFSLEGLTYELASA